MIANEEDLQAVLGIEVRACRRDRRRRSTSTAIARPPSGWSTEFGVAQVAVTLRESLSASDNGWSAVLFERATGAFHQSQRYNVRLVDRIGGGDSFAAGLIFGLVSGRDLASARCASRWRPAR